MNLGMKIVRQLRAAAGRRELELELEAPNTFRPPDARALAIGDVSDSRIAQPAQSALIRLSKVAATSASAVALLQHVKAQRIAGIHCLNSDPALRRAQALGSSVWQAIPAGEDAVLMLDPADVQQGAPLIAFRRELDPVCGLHKGEQNFPAKTAKLDAALLKALTSFTVWRAGLSLGGSAKCALAPLNDAKNTVDARRFASMRTLNNVLPRLLCQPRAVPTTPGTPRQVRHRHMRRTCDSAFSFVNDAAPSDLLPANMNPRFILPTDAVSVDPVLELRLNELIINKYAKFLAPQTVRTRTPGKDDRLRVALVDLTGRKLCQPGFAGFGAEFNVSGASTTKILLFYAAHQMLFDLREMVRIHRITNAADLIGRTMHEWSTFTCKPDLKWLFKFTPGGGLLTVENSDALQQHMTDVVTEVSSTGRASELIMRLGFEYIASVVWQSGLRHPQRGGLWFGSTYCGHGTRATPNPKCHAVVKAGSGCGKDDKGNELSRVVWTQDPLGSRGVVASALSVATYFTLMAQGRLVDPASSTAIEAFLTRACTFIGGAGIPGANVRAAKCGLTSNLKHDGALVENGGRRYAVAVLHERKGGTFMTHETFFELAKDLDKLIANHNP